MSSLFFTWSSLETNETLTQLSCEPATGPEESDINTPGHLRQEPTDAEIPELHKGKKVVGSGSRLKAQHSMATPSNRTSTPAPEMIPTVEGEEKSALVKTGSGGTNAADCNVSEENKGVGLCSRVVQKKTSSDGACRDQNKPDPCLQTASKSKIPKRSTPGYNAPPAARETSPERFTIQAQKQTCSKESSQSKVKVDKKHTKEKKEDIGAAGKRQESAKRTPPPAKPRQQQKGPDQGDSKASNDSNTPCLTGKNSNTTTLKDTTRPKSSPTTQGQQKSPTKETAGQVPHSPKTGKQLITLKWTPLLESRESHCFGGNIQFVG